MLSSGGFNLWADGYDADVRRTDESDEYPFAGYRNALSAIYTEIRLSRAKSVLDIGLGTGALATKLYRDGLQITGVDFSERMLEIAHVRMARAQLYMHDFALGLPPELLGARFDRIVSTYAMHHLDDAHKASLLRECAAHLTGGGRILIGDIAFETREALEECRARAGDEWDGDEFYFVFDEVQSALPDMRMTFAKISKCAGILEIWNK